MKNEDIIKSNKEAFKKTVDFDKKFIKQNLTDRSIIEDLRCENWNWTLTNCGICWKSLIVDWNEQDYTIKIQTEIHCSWCEKEALYALVF